MYFYNKLVLIRIDILKYFYRKQNAVSVLQNAHRGMDTLDNILQLSLRII